MHRGKAAGAAGAFGGTEERNNMVYRLNVPYREKEDAKRLGARWDFQNRFWYTTHEPEGGLLRWYTPDPADRAKNTMQTDALSRPGAAQEHPALDPSDPFTYRTVREVNEMIAQTFVQTQAFQFLMVRGEVTNYPGRGRGHYYFAVKDEENYVLPCVMWESEAARWLLPEEAEQTERSAGRFFLRNGMQVGIAGELTFFDRGGRAQIRVRRIYDLGAGALDFARKQLELRLEREGLFDPERKKPIPKHPERIGIVTSRHGQAIHDILDNARANNPFIEWILYDVKVQGENAVPEMVKGIRVLDSLGLDFILVARGGGSQEDLEAFSAEELIRAVCAAGTPVVSAVGHTHNHPLVERAADHYLPVPEAVKDLIPDVMTSLRRAEDLRVQLRRNMDHLLAQKKAAMQVRSASLEKNDPAVRLRLKKDRFQSLSSRLEQAMRALADRKRHRYEVLLARLNGLSPTAKLINGFGYISHAGKAVTSAGEVAVSDEILITLHDGTIEAAVTGTRKDRSAETGFARTGIGLEEGMGT